jgi:hypothetical protein
MGYRLLDARRHGVLFKGKETGIMKLRLTAVAMAVSALVIGPVYADGAGGCDYSGKWRSTSVEPQEQSEASKKLASLKMPIAGQETTAQAAAPEKAQESAPQAAEKTTTQ